MNRCKRQLEGKIRRISGGVDEGIRRVEMQRMLVGFEEMGGWGPTYSTRSTSEI